MGNFEIELEYCSLCAVYSHSPTDCCGKSRREHRPTGCRYVRGAEETEGKGPLPLSPVQDDRFRHADVVGHEDSGGGVVTEASRYSR